MIANTEHQAAVELNQVQLTHVVWSYEHEAWWRPGESGYSPNILAAGLYTHAEALAIEQRANQYEPPDMPCERAMTLADAMKFEAARWPIEVRGLCVYHVLRLGTAVTFRPSDPDAGVIDASPPPEVE